MPFENHVRDMATAVVRHDEVRAADHLFLALHRLPPGTVIDLATRLVMELLPLFRDGPGWFEGLEEELRRVDEVARDPDPARYVSRDAWAMPSQRVLSAAEVHFRAAIGNLLDAVDGRRFPEMITSAATGSILEALAAREMVAWRGADPPEVVAERRRGWLDLLARLEDLARQSAPEVNDDSGAARALARWRKHGGVLYPPALRLRIESQGAARELDEILYQPLFSTVHIELDVGRNQEPGPVAGAEGLGSQLFADSSRRVYAADIELLPFLVLDVPPADMMRPALELLRGARRAGVLYLDDSHTAALNPLKIWLSEPFGSAATIVFEPTALDPISALADTLAGLELVEVARGMTVACSRTDGRLWLILLEDFARTQTVLNRTISVSQGGQPLIDALNRLHLAFHRDPKPSVFAKICDDVVATLPADHVRNPEILAMFAGLGRFYEQQLRYWDQVTGGVRPRS